MPELSRLSGGSDAIELEFLEREATPTEIMQLGSHLYLGGLSLFKSVVILDRFGVSRARSIVHSWVRNADLEPRDGRDSEKIALHEMIYAQRGMFWLVAAVDPDTNIILHVGHYTSRNSAVTKLFCGSSMRNTPSTTPNFSSMSPLGSMPASSS